MLPEFHGLAFRHWLLRDATGRHALTWAAGGLRADGDDYGEVWFAFGELAYALRPSPGSPSSRVVERPFT